LDFHENHVFTISDREDGGGEAHCITCRLKNSNDEMCRTNQVILSKEFGYFLHGCMGPGVPEIAFRITADPTEVVFLAFDNAALRTKLEDVDLPQIAEFRNIPLASGELLGRARLHFPPNFNATNQYPLLMEIYGGPDTQMIDYSFRVGWGTTLASDKEVIHGFMDGRGTGRQTRQHLFAVNNRLGTVEVQDMIAMTKWLVQNTTYIDPNRTAIHGWSHGGYNTAMVLSQDVEGVFKCGISLAPVTTWFNHATVSVERYMGLPTAEDNLDNYLSGDVTTHVDNFVNKSFFLVHGTADENAHYQNSMVLARALEKAGILFDQLIYSDEKHDISLYHHRFRSFERFLFRDCFPEPSAREECLICGNHSTKNQPNLFFAFTFFTLLMSSLSIYVLL